MSITDKIIPVSDMAGPLSVLVWGRSGTGKTTFGSTFPRPILLVDVREKGSDGLAYEEGIDGLPLESWEELEELYWFLSENPDRYQTVIIDTVTQLQDLALEKVLADEGKTIDSPVSQSNWGSMSKMMKSWLLSFRDLPMNTVFVAQDRVNDVKGYEDQLVPEVGPRLSPSVAGMLCAAVKVICQTFIMEEVKRGKDNRIRRHITYRLRVGPHPLYLTKIRQPRGSPVPADIVNPSYSLLKKVVQGRWELAAADKVEEAEDEVPEVPKKVPEVPKKIRKALKRPEEV